ncbi:putative leader peptide [Streptomyces sp. NPDC050738]|uniref:putative leader peptide n=1 Tax=Streptomyces sp. NPDC050738 TaxID=3154744 RepID=UPI0034130A9D
MGPSRQLTSSCPPYGTWLSGRAVRGQDAGMTPALVSRRHVDLQRVSSMLCRVKSSPLSGC